jgi:hypothetical protein
MYTFLFDGPLSAFVEWLPQLAEWQPAQ